MRQSTSFGKTRHEVPKDEVSINAQLLIRAGFIDKVTAGVYSYLPLGLRVLKKIQNIVRVEMNALPAEEVLMPALHPQELWAATGRWNDPGAGVMFQFKGHGSQEYGLGWTHEEIITPMVKKFVHSYKDLPRALYQIQDKFRNEPRAKSGMLRGREFNMKDLYSFHRTVKDLDAFYDRVMAAYQRIFAEVGLRSLVVEASGGSFSPLSHEFQAPTPAGEDIVYSCRACNRHQNKEIVTAAACPSCNGAREEVKAIEVGNIFKLGTRFTDAFDVTYTDEEGSRQPIYMGCYGLGPSRVMGSIVEVHHDAEGIQWPERVAPFKVHLVALEATDKEVQKVAEALYVELIHKGIEVLFDDRADASPGEKFADSDLMGIPWRAVVSKKTVKKGAHEVKRRTEENISFMETNQLVHALC